MSLSPSHRTGGKGGLLKEITQEAGRKGTLSVGNHTEEGEGIEVPFSTPALPVLKIAAGGHFGSTFLTAHSNLEGPW
jgi:hypothetical protein